MDDMDGIVPPKSVLQKFCGPYTSRHLAKIAAIFDSHPDQISEIHINSGALRIVYLTTVGSREKGTLDVYKTERCFSLDRAPRGRGTYTEKVDYIVRDNQSVSPWTHLKIGTEEQAQSGWD